MLVAGSLILFGFGMLWVVFKLADKALDDRRSVRASARLGPSSFFLEVNDEQKDEPPSLKK